MSYCLNPNCPQPHNDDRFQFCQSCGARLLLKDSYLAIAPIGEGGMGRTFRAVNRAKFNQPCAIKQLMLQYQAGSHRHKAIELFNREAAQLQSLGKHPQIPELIAYFEQDNSLYLVQELIEGRNLLDEMKEQGAFDEAKIRELLLDLLPVLQFIHERGVIHRDVKPENIIRRRSPLTPEGWQLVLVDFGASKVVSAATVSKTGTFIGSAEYTAPEQLRGKATFASDIYSLGATCIHLLTTISPFDLYNDVEDRWIWRQYLKEPVSESLGNILDRMLAKPTSNRFESAGIILDILNKKSQILSLVITKRSGDDDKIEPTGNYSKLKELLETGNWLEADRETTAIILKLTSKDRIRDITRQNIEILSCADLYELDRMWNYYSNQKFGFSVQKEIWQSIGGVLFYDSRNYWKFAETYIKFAERTGWAKKSWFSDSRWLKYKDLNFSINAPRGHLPAIFHWHGHEVMDALFLRIKVCGY
jgi:serine/threonine protein kinase